MSLVVALLGIIVVASMGLTYQYVMTGNLSLGLTYFGATLLYLGLLLKEIL